MSNFPATQTVEGTVSASDKTKIDTVASYAAMVHDYQFGRSTQVPGGGTLQLLGPGDTTVPLRVNRAGAIVGASIQVNMVDASRTFDLQIWQNGASVATVSLPLSTLGAARSDLNVAVAVGDLILAYLVRTTGVGASTFSNEHAMIEVKY